MPDPNTVYVVHAVYMDDPHAHVEAVYVDEPLADAHISAIADSSSPSAPIAWGKSEQPIKREIDACPICESEDERRTKEQSFPLDNVEQCTNCRAEIPIVE